MSQEEAIEMLHKIEDVVVQIYEQRLFGEEVQPCITQVQRLSKQLQDYIITHTTPPNQLTQ